MIDLNEGRIEINTKWSKGNVLKDDNSIGHLSIKENEIMFNIEGTGDIFARNFIGYSEGKTFKVFTYGQQELDSTGCFYRVSKACLYIGDNYAYDKDDNIINGIESFSFEIPELVDWLKIPSVEFGILDDKTPIIHELETPIISLKDEKVKVYIKYENSNLWEGISNINEMTLRKKPRIFVEFEKTQNDTMVVNYIRILTRFFSMLIGKVSSAIDIRLSLKSEKTSVWLFINEDFSVNNEVNLYSISYRTTYQEVSEQLKIWFETWYDFSNDSSFMFLQNYFFSSCSKKHWMIEELFLTYVKFIEGYDLRISQDEKKAESLYESLVDVMKSHDIIKILLPEFKKVGSKSKYKEKDIARWISNGFFERVKLDARIKRIDERFFKIISSNSSNVIEGISSNDLYEKIAKTRNYYSHFKPDSEGILDMKEIYNLIPVMKFMITIILLSHMGLDNDKIESIIIKDDVFWSFTKHLRKEK